MRPHGTPEELERRRRRALTLLAAGRTAREVAEMVGVRVRSVERWAKAKREGGVRALRAKPASGRPPKLSADERTRLEAVLLEGAQAHGFNTDLWTCPRIAEVIRKQFEVTYHVDHIPKLLHQLGWSAQKPMRRALERDEAAIQRWVKADWKRVKKTPSRNGR
jgi:transposase